MQNGPSSNTGVRTMHVMMRFHSAQAANPLRRTPPLRPRWRFAGLLAAALLMGIQGWAAEGETQTPAAEPSAENDAEPAADVFIPTEDISEDFAVAFPVDI